MYIGCMITVWKTIIILNMSNNIVDCSRQENKHLLIVFQYICDSY